MVGKVRCHWHRNSCKISISARFTLIPSQEIPNEFKRWKLYLEKLKNGLKKKIISFGSMYSFYFKTKKIDKIILGIDSLNHLTEILKIDFKKNISGFQKYPLQMNL